MRVLFFLFFCISTVQSQKILLKGSVIDSETKQPVAYANISFLKSNKGISSNEDGTFSLEIDKELLKDKVHISCLNYKDTIVKAFDLQNKNLKMQSKNEVLSEVVISKEVDKELIVGKIKRRKVKTSLIGTAKIPWVVARYFEYKVEYEKTPFIKEIKIYLSNIKKRKSKFRVRLFLKNSVSNLPKKDLLKKSLIVSVEKREKYVELDLLKYNIEIPKSGIFIALERLNIPYNFYEDVFKYKDSITEKVTRVAPDFGGVPVDNEKRYSYSKGKWWSSEKDISFYKEKTVVPAISVTLSN